MGYVLVKVNEPSVFTSFLVLILFKTKDVLASVSDDEVPVTRTGSARYPLRKFTCCRIDLFKSICCFSDSLLCFYKWAKFQISFPFHF